MEILLFMAGVILGFIVGSIFGMCQMDNLHRRVKNQKWRGEVPRSKRAPPKPLHNPNK